MTAVEHPVSGSFIGREDQLADLTALLSAAWSGRGSLALVGGAPGIGKTRLAEQLAERAQEAGVAVLWGRCLEGDGVPPFWPWVEAAGAWLRGQTAAAAQAALADDAGLVAQIVPRVREVLRHVPEPPPVVLGDGRFSLFESVVAFLRRAAEAQPILLILDDLHWADIPSLQLLEFLARDLHHGRLLVVATYRDEALPRGHALTRTLGDITRWPHVHRMRLSGLTAAEIGRLVESTAGIAAPEPLIDMLARRTEGNPLFVREFTRLWAAGGQTGPEPRPPDHMLAVPRTVRDVIGRRLATLSHPCYETLISAAVIGQEFDVRDLAHVEGHSPADLLDVLEEAELSGIVLPAVEVADRYRFAHALVHETLYVETSAARRARLHGRVALALEARYGRDPAPPLAALALHWRLAGPAGDPLKAISYAIRAGKAASDAYAWEDAVAEWERAIDLLQRYAPQSEEQARVAMLLANTRYATGLDVARARQALEQALAVEERAGRSRTLAQLHICAGNNLTKYHATLDVPRALQHLRTAEALLNPEQDLDLLGIVSIGVASAANWGVYPAEGLRATERTMALGDRLSNDTMWAVGAGLHGAFHGYSGRIAEATSWMERAWRRCQDMHTGGYWIAWAAISLQLDLANPIAAQTWVERALHARRSQIQPGRRRFLLRQWAGIAALQGQLAEAERMLKEAAAEEEREPPVFRDYSGTEKLAISYLNEPAVAEALWRSSIEFQRDSGVRVTGWGDRIGLAQSLRLRGEPVAAEPLCREALAITLDAPHIPWELTTRTELALLESGFGRQRAARQHLRRCQTILESGEDFHGLTARVAFAEAVVAAAEGYPEEAAEHFAAAIALFRRLQLPWDEAEAHLAWGASLQTLDPAAAAQRFDLADAIYRRMGAAPAWTARVAASRAALHP